MGKTLRIDIFGKLSSNTTDLDILLNIINLFGDVYNDIIFVNIPFSGIKKDIWEKFLPAQRIEWNINNVDTDVIIKINLDTIFPLFMSLPDMKIDSVENINYMPIKGVIHKESLDDLKEGLIHIIPEYDSSTLPIVNNMDIEGNIISSVPIITDREVFLVNEKILKNSAREGKIII